MNDPSKFESAFAIGFELSNNFLSRIRGRGIGNNPAYKRAMLFFLCKALRTYQGAHHLWVGGYMEDGRSHARGIFEIRLQARYMVIEPDIRSAQFTRHWQRSSWRALRRWAASGRVRGLRIEGHDPKRAKARPPVNENWWEKKGIQALAKDLGLEDEYFTYWRLSDFVHSASTQLFRYWTESDGVISLCHGPTSSVEDPFLYDATRWLIEIVACAANAFELDMVDEIGIAAKSVSELTFVADT